MQKCLAKGLNLQTWTPVTSVTASSQTSGSWDVNTARGSISTPTVVYATNAYTSAILPAFAKYIQPTAHMCNKVVPPRAFSGSKALQNSYGVLAPGGLYSINPRSNADGILLFGGSNPNQSQLKAYLDADPNRLFDDSLSNFKPVTDAVEDFTSTAFDGWKDGLPAPGVGTEYAWSGIVGLVSHHLLTYMPIKPSNVLGNRARTASPSSGRCPSSRASGSAQGSTDTAWRTYSPARWGLSR